MNRKEIAPYEITKVSAAQPSKATDLLAVEEPLQISICENFKTKSILKNIAVTMRTPGNDEELALGFLVTEGILKPNSEAVKTQQEVWSDNTILVENPGLKEGMLLSLDRNFYTTSSCGVCGKSSIDAIRTQCEPVTWKHNNNISKELLLSLPDLLRKQQAIFENTGGLHASALFNTDAELLLLREDVGRHNALDKLIGAAYIKQLLPLNKQLLLLSGRASFELIQKAGMAGIAIVAAVGAPSSLAVQLAAELNITLIGFLRDQRFNIYTHPNRIVL